jgi:type II secretory pathway pseudopilin PulG
MEFKTRRAESGERRGESAEGRAQSEEGRAKRGEGREERGVDSCSTPASFRAPRHASAFTLIEIAISLAVIAFALVAIIGVLPIGLGVQKDNRQETIINQDASVLMDAIRNGQRGLDDLTNYVFAITNFVTAFDTNSGVASSSQQGYTFANSTPSGFLLTNGFRIIGLLSTPRITPGAPGSVNSNYIVAYIRSISGPASEKFPQTNRDVQDLALSYRMIPELSPYAEYDTNWTQNTAQDNSFRRTATGLENNLYNLRLTFRWPLLPNGDSGPGRQVFRTMASGALLTTNEPGFTNPLYVLQPRTYVKTP